MDRENESLKHDLTLGNDVLNVLSVELTDDLEHMRSRVTRGRHLTPPHPPAPHHSYDPLGTGKIRHPTRGN